MLGKFVSYVCFYLFIKEKRNIKKKLLCKKKKEINIKFIIWNVNVNLYVILEIILMVEWECFIIKKKVYGVWFYILNIRL